MKRWVPIAVVIVLGIAAGYVGSLHPRWHRPPPLDPKAPLELSLADAPGPVEIRVDGYGVPHIYADTREALVFGLGFMHARERLFQLEAVRHAAWGRLTELFGDRVLETDKRLRVVSHGVENIANRLPESQRKLVESYARGVNAGAAHAGTPSELALLRKDFAPFGTDDVLAIARLQAWQLSQDMASELLRARVLGALPAGDARREIWMRPVSAGGVSIASHAPTPGTADMPDDADHSTSPADEDPGDGDNGDSEEDEEASLRLPTDSERDPWAREGYPGQGASNSWVVSADKTAAGVPVLCNDPHLRHRLPGVFYLAHLEHPDVTVAGATFPGLPAVVIGHTRHLAWGMTTSFADTQDLVALDVDPSDPLRYRVDGNWTSFESQPEQFLDGSGNVIAEVTWRTSQFGPVLEGGWEESLPPVDAPTYALQWAGFDEEAQLEVFDSFWNLYQAKTPTEADEAIAGLTFTGQNMALAFTDGTIAYRLAANLPVRSATISSHRPQDGRSSAAKWRGFIPGPQVVSINNPPGGFIVAANQRVVDDGTPAAYQVGSHAAPSYRAERITERLRPMVEKGHVATADLASIQHDTGSPVAKRLLPVLRENCPKSLPGAPEARVRGFCEALENWDGNFDPEDAGALVFDRWMHAIRAHIIGSMGLEECVDCVLVRVRAEEALLALGRGETSPLFVTEPASMLGHAAEMAMDEIVDIAGGDPAGWRWGKAHVLYRRGPLAALPVIGSWFEATPHEEGGHWSSPRAEGDVPVASGAALRMVVELTTPPRAKMVSDTGQSGHPGAEHWEDAVPAWRGDEPLWTLPMTRAEVESQTVGVLKLAPR